MALVKGSNGLVFDFPDAVAADLIRGGHAEEAKRPAPKGKKQESAEADDKQEVIVVASFATFEQFTARTNRTFEVSEQPLVEQLLEDASTYLRSIIGADLYPRRTVTARLWPSVDGTIALPRPVFGVTSVTRDGAPVDFKQIDDATLAGIGDVVDVTFDYGYTEAPAELTRWTVLLAFQALVAIELELGQTMAGLSSVAIDDFRFGIADGGEHTGITMSDRNADRLRREFGTPSFVVVNQR